MCFGSCRLLQAYGTRVCQTRPGTYSLWNHQGCRKLSAYGKTQYYIQCGKTFWFLYHSHWRCHIGLRRTHINAITLALILILTIDRPCRQCSRSSICQSPWSVSMNPVHNWIQSNVTSKVRMGLTSWPRRHTWLGRSCSQLISWQQLQYIRIETNFNSRPFNNIRDYSYPLQLDAAPNQSSLPHLPTSATPTQHGQPNRTIYATTTEATDTTTTTELLDYCANCVTFGLTV